VSEILKALPKLKEFDVIKGFLGTREKEHEREREEDILSKEGQEKG